MQISDVVVAAVLLSSEDRRVRVFGGFAAWFIIIPLMVTAALITRSYLSEYIKRRTIDEVVPKGSAAKSKRSSPQPHASLASIKPLEQSRLRPGSNDQVPSLGLGDPASEGRNPDGTIPHAVSTQLWQDVSQVTTSASFLAEISVSSP